MTMKHLHNVLLGFTALATLSNQPAYPDLRNGFARDRQRLRDDVKTVTTQLNQEIKKNQDIYGKQKYSA